ncbi:MAG: repeat protein [Pedosphaera sp.]|nr:repeat protein [Pedosphaera sp.]
MKRLRPIAIVGVVLSLGWLMFPFAEPKEPSYQGRRLSEWITDYETGVSGVIIGQKRVEVMRSARHAVKAIGTNAIPTLLQWLQATNSPKKVTLNKLLDKQSLIHFRFRGAGDWQLMAAEGFNLLGNDAEPAVPALTQLLGSEDKNLWARVWDCFFLIEQDKKILSPIILQLLHNQNVNIRFGAADYLSKVHKDEAEKAGIYKMFPELKPPTTNTLETNSPAAK